MAATAVPLPPAVVQQIGATLGASYLGSMGTAMYASIHSHDLHGSPNAHTGFSGSPIFKLISTLGIISMIGSFKSAWSLIFGRITHLFI